MRTRRWAVVGLLGVALLLVGCSGEQERPAPEQAEQEHVEPEEQSGPAPSEPQQQAVGQPGSGAAAGEPSSAVGNEDRQSGEVEDGQRESAEDRPPEMARERSADGSIGFGDDDLVVEHALRCDSDSVVAEAERAASREQTAQADDAQAGEPADLDDEVPEETLALIAAATEAMAGWYSELETVTLEASLAAEWDGRCIELEVSSAIEPKRQAAWSVGDFSPWFELWTGLPLAEAEELVVLQDYLLKGSVYSTVSGMGGWGRNLFHWRLDYDDGLIDQWFGVEPSEFVGYGRDGDELQCAALEGGSIVEDQYEGEAVWVVRCQTEANSFMPFDGGTYIDDEVVLTVSEVTISQASGAPLVTEYRRASRDREGWLNWSFRRVVLTGWNEPVDFPTPEPPVEGTEYRELLERLRERSATPERLLALAEAWLGEQDDMLGALSIRLETDDEGRGWSIVDESRFEETFRRDFLVWVPSGRGERRLRLVWNGDGFWASEAEVDNEPVWTVSTPAEHGLGGVRLEELLDERHLIDLELFRDLFDGSEASADFGDLGETDYYWLAIDSGAFEPGDMHFDRIAALFEAAVIGLEIGDAAVRRIESFGLYVTLEAGRRRVGSLAALGEFLTDAGMFTLRLRVDDDPFGRESLAPSQ